MDRVVDLDPVELVVESVQQLAQLALDCSTRDATVYGGFKEMVDPISGARHRPVSIAYRGVTSLSAVTAVVRADNGAHDSTHREGRQCCSALRGG